MKAGMFVFCAVLALLGTAAAADRPGGLVVPIALMAVLSGDISFVGKECRDGFEAARRVYAPGDSP